MYVRLAVIVLVAIATPASVVAQQPEAYAPPRTEHGHPDFQGVWSPEFITSLERRVDVPNLVATPEQAAAIVANSWTRWADINQDPDVFNHDIRQVAIVKGELRTSVIVEPEDGRLPFTQAGLDLAAWAGTRQRQMFDHAGQRPLVERCMESYGDPPMRSIPYFIPRQIFQNGDHFVMLTEDPTGLRIIRLGAEPPPDSVRSTQGYSIGLWEGDTLAVQTTNLRAEDPARFGSARPLLISPDTKIEERFTRVSETELFYRYTVEDDGLYTQPWSGEFSMVLWDDPIYEYACHEGNYSMPNALRGGQADAARLAEAEPGR